MSALASEGGSSNTPPQNTRPAFDSVSIDWFGGTLPDTVDALSEVSELLGFETSTWSEGHGGMGYSHSWRHPSGVVVYDQGFPGTGQHVALSGTVCQALEIHWPSFLAKFIDLGGKPSRLDLAIDDVTGWVNLDLLTAAAYSGLVVSRYNSPVRIYQTVDHLTGANMGRTVYFGSGKGNSLVRFYDKAKEQNVTGHWIRSEIQYRHESAVAVCARVLNGQDLPELAFGLLGGLVSVRERGEDSNRSRWKVQDWWEKFTQGFKKFALGVSRPRNSFKKKIEWLSRSCSKGLGQACIVEGPEFIAHLVAKGISRTTENDWLQLGFLPRMDFNSILEPFKLLTEVYGDEKPITEQSFLSTCQPLSA